MESLFANCSYKIVSNIYISSLDYDVIDSFYMPVIGTLSVRLYKTFIKEIDKENTHFHLMNNFNVSDKELEKARFSLEAVGLLKSYKSADNKYLYEVYSPLLPNEFLSHPILSIVLLNAIGKDEYDVLINKYAKKKINYTNYEEITKQMDEVYKVENYNSEGDFKERNSLPIKLTSKIDYEVLKKEIPSNIISEKAFNKKTVELIDNLSFIYNIDTIKMQEFIRKSINEFGMIDKEELRKTARKYYELSSNSLPTIVYRTQPEYLKKISKDNSLRSQTIAMFENVSPYDFLKMKNGGAKPTNKDLKLIETLLLDLELTPAVVNVLIDYVLRKNNNRLTNGYVEAIAGQWKRAKLLTAEQAMVFASKEQKKQKHGNNIEVKTPVWFDQNIEKKEMSKEEIDELESMLKEFK